MDQLNKTSGSLVCCVMCGRDTQDDSELCDRCRPSYTGWGNKSVGSSMTGTQDLTHEPVEDDYSEESDAQRVHIATEIYVNGLACAVGPDRLICIAG